MTLSILVVDFGNYETTAALVTEDQIQAVACPPAWNSHLDIHYLRTVIAAAAAAHGRIDRLALTIPTSFGRDPAKREAVVAMAAEAGFADVELISDSVAAMMDPNTRPDLPDGALVLLCDLGVSWSTTLIRLQPDQPLQLAEETAAESLTRAGLEILTDSALRWLTASCRAMVARANVHLSEVDAVVLVGGGARLPVAGQVLHAELGRPVFQPADPEFAVVRGAAKWASQATGGRAIKATPASWRVEPLSWPAPDRARLLRWLVAEGQPYAHGTCLAQVRTPDDRVYDLTALREGIMLEHRVHPGDPLGSGAIAAMARSAMLISNDRPTKHLTLQVSGEWMLTGDRRHLVECADSGAYVRMRAISSGAVVAGGVSGHDTAVRPGVRPPRRAAGPGLLGRRGPLRRVGGAVGKVDVAVPGEREAAVGEGARGRLASGVGGGSQGQRRPVPPRRGHHVGPGHRRGGGRNRRR